MRVLLCTLLGFCCSVTSAATSKIDKTIEPGKGHEECMDILPSQTLRYSFKAGSDLKFNIHYHSGKDVFYPVKKDKTSAEKGEFKPTVKQDYCMMWSNDSKSTINLKYEFDLK